MTTAIKQTSPRTKTCTTVSSTKKGHAWRGLAWKIKRQSEWKTDNQDWLMITYERWLQLALYVLPTHDLPHTETMQHTVKAAKYYNIKCKMWLTFDGPDSAKRLYSTVDTGWREADPEVACRSHPKHAARVGISCEPRRSPLTDLPWIWSRLNSIWKG